MSILEIVLGCLAAVVVWVALASLMGQWLRSVRRHYPTVGGDED